MDPGDAASQVDPIVAGYLSSAVRGRAKLRRMLRNLSRDQLADLLDALGELSTFTNEENRGRHATSDPTAAHLESGG